MSAKEEFKISKTLSYVLRHRPDEMGIILDENGYVGVDELIHQFNAYSQIKLTLEKLKQVVANNDKQRFAFSADGSMIRASQGHSVQVDLGYEAQTPPEFLYHGTAASNLPSIRKSGLAKRSRHHVHLSPDVDTAKNVGARHGVPVVLPIKALEMHQDGKVFYKSANGVWLTNEVPVDYIILPH
ncbi:RNA 2'-phosphotransferase [Cytophagaceae bacterium DM2B3-1]|uniref:Probable RNA 2'-phosphotransferase n=1 Tax=Xanthocytophaga flava TaxID=3048013 RepID=A0ABT7CLU1_9BACT|nr:RNA 2'-phosphotransferase [Xanthocytophaga flavus]MDJ1494667.1 RNA 2'-phosphotransferase [Xanthocytophaga flavus]